MLLIHEMFLQPALCLFARKQPKYIFLMGLSFVTAIPKCETTDAAT